MNTPIYDELAPSYGYPATEDSDCQHPGWVSQRGLWRCCICRLVSWSLPAPHEMLPPPEEMDF